MSIGTPELVVCALIALVVLGPERLPGAARTLGRALKEFRKISNDVSGQVKSFIEEEPDDSQSDRPDASTTDGRDYSQPQQTANTAQGMPANAPQRRAVRSAPDASQFAVIPDPRNYDPTKPDTSRPDTSQPETHDFDARRPNTPKRPDSDGHA